MIMPIIQSQPHPKLNPSLVIAAAIVIILAAVVVVNRVIHLFEFLVSRRYQYRVNHHFALDKVAPLT
jgi:hypothetical protein